MKRNGGEKGLRGGIRGTRAKAEKKVKGRIECAERAKGENKK